MPADADHVQAFGDDLGDARHLDDDLRAPAIREVTDVLGASLAGVVLAEVDRVIRAELTRKLQTQRHGIDDDHGRATFLGDGACIQAARPPAPWMTTFWPALTSAASTATSICDKAQLAAAASLSATVSGTLKKNCPGWT